MTFSYKKILIICALPLFLAGCSTATTLFGDPPEEKLEGERMTILQLQEQLEPDPVLATSLIEIPAPWENQFWPQYYGYPNHAMGHVALGDAGAGGLVDTGAMTLKRDWSASIGNGIDTKRPLVAQPVIADGRVFTLGTSLRLSAFNVENGKRLWSEKIKVPRKMRGHTIGGGLAYTGGELYATIGTKTAYVINARDGSVIREISLPSPARAAPTVLDKRLYIQTLDNKLLTYSLEDYTLQWTHNGFNEVTSLLGAPSPAADKETVVTAFSSGEVIAFRNINGQSLWMDNLSSVRQAEAVSNIADIRGGVVVDRGLVYAISHGGRMIAIDVLTGQRVWQKDIGGTQTPWAVGSVVYVITNDNQLAALSRLDGRLHWVTPLPALHKNKDDLKNLWFGPILAGGRLIAVSNYGVMMHIDPANGAVLATQKLKSKFSRPPIVAGGTLYMVTNGGRLHAYR